MTVTELEMEPKESDEPLLEDDNKEDHDKLEVGMSSERGLTARDCLLISILFAINLLNYMDRLTIAGVLTSIQTYYNINDQAAGLLQTAFLAVFMVFSMVFGYLGDRYNRKWLLTAGIGIWISAVLGCTFCPPNAFYMFVVMRGLVGLGQSSYSIVAPTMIADFFRADIRSKALMVFYFAIPVGSGLGYMVGSAVATAFDDWRWGLRVTCIYGLFCLMCFLLFVPEPSRATPTAQSAASRSYLRDIAQLAKNKTFVFSTLAVTGVMFASGTLSWWTPAILSHSMAMQLGLNDTALLTAQQKDSIGLCFGGISLVAGVLGVGLGSSLASGWKRGAWGCARTVRADALVSGIGSALGTPLLLAVFAVVGSNMTLAWILMLLAVTALCLNWAASVDLLLAVVPAEARATAAALQTAVGHALGDAAGPLLVGLGSDAARAGRHSPAARFHALLRAFRLPNLVLLLSAGAFFAAAATMPRDLRRLRPRLSSPPKPKPTEEAAS